jgi:hypothetical protein
VQTLKNILKFFLYTGAVACCLAGLGAIYIVFTNVSQLNYPPDSYTLALVAIYLTLAFMPAFMFLKASKTKTLQWVFTAMVEVIVLAPALYVELIRFGFIHQA